MFAERDAHELFEHRVHVEEHGRAYQSAVAVFKRRVAENQAGPLDCPAIVLIQSRIQDRRHVSWIIGLETDEFEDRLEAVAARLREAGHENVFVHANSRRVLDSYNWSLMQLLLNSVFVKLGPSIEDRLDSITGLYESFVGHSKSRSPKAPAGSKGNGRVTGGRPARNR